MIKKRNLVLLVVITIPFLFGAFSYKKSAGAHPGSTGAPGDNTCAKVGCHVGAPVTYADTTVNQLIFSSPDSTYVPGQTYTITVKTQNPGIMRFGFELQALEDSTSKDVGTIVITDPARTHTLTHSVLGSSRTSATHSLSGTPALSAGYNEWTFNWTAPATNEGIITFYYATNSTNNSNTPSGDLIFCNIFKIKPAASSAINEYIDEQNMNVHFDQIGNQIVLNYYLKMNKKITVKVFDSMGREVLKHTDRNKMQGQQRDELSLERTLSKGIYYVNLIVGNKSLTKKIYINQN